MKVFYHHIRHPHQPQERFPAGIRLEVDSDAPLVALQLYEDGVPVPRLVAGAAIDPAAEGLVHREIPRPPAHRRFDLDYLGP